MRNSYPSYEQWLSVEQFESKFSSINVTSIEATKLVAEALLEKVEFSSKEKLFFEILKESETSFLDWEDINEGLMAKLKEVGQKMIDKGKKGIEDFKKDIISDIKGIPDFFRTLASGIKRVCGYIKEYLTKVMKYMFGDNAGFVKKAMGNSRMDAAETKLKEASKKEPVKIQIEAKGVKDIVSGISKLVTPEKISAAVQKGVESGENSEIKRKDLEVTIAERLEAAVLLSVSEAIKLHSKEEILNGFLAINEAEEQGDHEHKYAHIPLISTLQNLIEKIPPFNWLAKLAHVISKYSNKALTNISKLLQSKNVIEKATEFSILGGFIGLEIELLIKDGVKHALGYFFPVINSTLLVLSVIAITIWYVHIISNFVDGLEEVTQEIEDLADDMATQES